MSAINLTDKNFDAEVINTTESVLVDFWASWCGPCRMLSPIIEQLSNEHPEIKVCKVNVDDNPELAQKFRVVSIPMLVAFKNGKQVKSGVGLQSKEQIMALFGE